MPTISRKEARTPESHHFQPRKKTAEHYFRWVEKFVNKGNLLEVGCATGLALKVAQDHGWKVFGVEVNEKAAIWLMVS